MSKIRIHFDDLCAFFTKYPERLMVGMMATEGDGAEHLHKPHVVIRQGGVVVREYRGFDEVRGDISLRVFPQRAPLRRHVTASDDDARKPFELSKV